MKGASARNIQGSQHLNMKKIIGEEKGNYEG